MLRATQLNLVNQQLMISCRSWYEIVVMADRENWATPVRAPVPSPSEWPSPAADLQLPGQIPPEVLADETKMLERLGYTNEEIKEAQLQTIPQGGEPAARVSLEAWVSWCK